MTTHFDQARAGRDDASRRGGDTAPNSDGVHDLVIMALSELARGLSGTEALAADTESLPEAHVVTMARLMVNPHSTEAEELVTDLLSAGVTVQDLCMSHIGPAARELGRLWVCDKLAFAEVTIATARMQVILRNLPGKPRSSSCQQHRGALFAAPPGETHTLGVLMAADHFRRLGWDIGVLVGLNHDTLMRQIIADDRPAVGLSCAGMHSFSALKRLIEDIQARRPEVAVVLSGAIVLEPEALAMLPDCDGVSDSLETAELDVADAIALALPRAQRTKTEATG